MRNSECGIWSRSRDPACAGDFNFGIRPAFAGSRMCGRIRKSESEKKGEVDGRKLLMAAPTGVRGRPYLGLRGEA